MAKKRKNSDVKKTILSILTIGLIVGIVVMIGIGTSGFTDWTGRNSSSGSNNSISSSMNSYNSANDSSNSSLSSSSTPLISSTSSSSSGSTIESGTSTGYFLLGDETLREQNTNNYDLSNSCCYEKNLAFFKNYFMWQFTFNESDVEKLTGYYALNNGVIEKIDFDNCDYCLLSNSGKTVTLYTAWDDTTGTFNHFPFIITTTASHAVDYTLTYYYRV